MGAVNKAIVLGNLGADPESRFTQDGTQVVTLRVATSERYKDRDGNQKETTEWHRVVVWGKQAEACAQYLSKGRQVYVEGKMQTKEWTDKDGVKRWSTEIVAQSVVFLGGGGGGESSSGGSSGGGRGRGGSESGGGRGRGAGHGHEPASPSSPGDWSAPPAEEDVPF